MMRSSEPFHHFVDDYLAYLHEVHPTGATLDGVHTYDDHIEDFSRNAIDQHTRALSGFSRRLQDINLSDLTAVEKAEQPMVASNIQALESETWAKEKLGRTEAVGKIDRSRLNVSGGSIANGTPVWPFRSIAAASGTAGGAPPFPMRSMAMAIFRYSGAHLR